MQTEGRVRAPRVAGGGYRGENCRMHPVSRRWLLVLLPLAAACGRGSAPAVATESAADTMLLPAPAESSLGNDPVSRSIKRGLALVSATRDSLPSHVGAD